MQAKDIAAQLRQPQGEAGREVAARMNQSNQGINQRCLKLLQPPAGSHILEIGPGNGAFVPELLALAPDLQYTGLDWSADMVSLARTEQAVLVQAEQARFLQGDAAAMPFPDHRFQRVLTVNTLYFWADPVQVLREIRRVLSPDGQLCIAFGDRHFMQAMAFAQHGFQLYDAAMATHCLEAAGLQLLSAHEDHSSERSHTGEVVQKHYHVLLASPAS